MTLHFDYTASKAYCAQIGLTWLEGMVDNADADCFAAGMTQAQVDIAMRHHLWNVRHLFDPKAYKWRDRLKLVLWFLVGIHP